jgi:hypothetical protein
LLKQEEPPASGSQEKVDEEYIFMSDNNAHVHNSQSITKREDARDLSPEEKLSPIDQQNLNYEEVLDKVLSINEIRESIGEEHVDDYRQALMEDFELGSKKLLDLVEWYNAKFPNNPILIPSDYVTDVREAAEPDWIINGIAVKNNTGMFHGEAGVGKTTLYLHLTDALMNGSAFAGIQCTRCKPLIICQDEDHSLLKNQWSTMGKTGLLPVAKKDILWGKNDFNVDLELTLTAYKPDIVFIDSYTSLGIPDITRPESGLVFDSMNRLARKHKCAIILIHHSNLSGEQMGSSLHRAKVSSMISITKSDEDHIVITQEKVRGSHFEPIVIRFDREHLTMEREAGSLREQVWRLLDEASTNVDRAAVANSIVQRFPTRKKDTIQRYVREYYNRRTEGGTAPNQGG